MYNGVTVRRYPAAPPDRAQVLRYAGIRREDAGLRALVDECLTLSAGAFEWAACRAVWPLRRTGELVDCGFAALRSRSLTGALEDCEAVAAFAATVGFGIDRLLQRYGHLSVARAAVLQAVGTAQIEQLCDVVCAEIAQEAAAQGLYARPRFSPGYGDVPLTLQTELFAALDVPHRIGVTLTDSLLMAPSKSVTALVGLSRRPCRGPAGCAGCPDTECPFREEKKS